MSDKKIISIEEQLLIDLLFGRTELKKKNFNNINYENLVKISSSHLMLPSLYINLKEKKLLKYVPMELKNYLREIYTINKERNEILIEEVNIISKILITNNINHVFLKGAAHIICKIYIDIGQRMIGDIDILIDKNQCKRAIKLLNLNGYKPIEGNYFFLNESKHYIRQCKKNKIFAIEIHKKLLSKKNSEKFNIDEFLTKRMKVNGIYTPSINDQLKHNIYNYQINDYGNTKLSYSYRSLYDTYVLTKRTTEYQKEIKLDNYINNYFMIAEELKIPKLNLFTLTNIAANTYRFKLKLSNKLYYKIDSFIINQIIQLKFRPKQIIELIINKKYRKHIIKKVKGIINL